MVNEINICRTPEYIRIRNEREAYKAGNLPHHKNKNYKKRKKLFSIMCLSVFTAAVIFLLILIISPARAEAKDNSDNYYKYFHTYIVHEGDSLWAIASEFSVGDINAYIDEVKSINHKFDDNLKAGELIVIPYYSLDYK